MVLLAVVGFYSYARYKVSRTVAEIPKKLGIDVQQSTQGFTFSKSEGGRTLFSISAGRAVQYKQGQRASLNNVRIIVYGRDEAGGAEHYDQIFGKEFEYEPNSGDVTAKGEVLIDLEASGKPAPSADSTGGVGTIHLKTSGLKFNQNSGLAQTDDAVEFSLPQASGSAVGARYDSRGMTLRLLKDVIVRTSTINDKSRKQSLSAATLTAKDAVISDQPRRALLSGVHLEQRNRKVNADTVIISLRENNAIGRIVASGNVNATSSGPTVSEIHTAEADFAFGAANALQTLTLTGGVSWQAEGASAMQGSSKRAIVSFADNKITKIRAMEQVSFNQNLDSSRRPTQTGSTSSGQGTQIKAESLDLYFRNGNQLERAESDGASQIELTSLVVFVEGGPVGGTTRGPTHTVITAGKFDAAFAGKNRLKTIHGAPNAKIVSSTPGQPPRVSTSREITAQFDSSLRGGISRVIQQGDVRYTDGPRSASGDAAEYIIADDSIGLSGSPRVQDSDAGLAVAATLIKIARGGQSMTAKGEVKSTFKPAKAATAGALLSSSNNEPVHVTADEMNYSRQLAMAKYTGNARLWQGADVVLAPQITFDQGARTIVASSSEAVSSPRSVKLSFVQAGKDGKLNQVTVTGSRLTYSDKTRQARFAGPVEVKMPEGTLDADVVEVSLKAKAPTAGGKDSASQIEKIVAQGNLKIQQQIPERKATGQELVYTPDSGKFVLTGKPGESASIFDAEHGNVTGNSLTFYSHDDRVQVGSSENSRTVTQTRIKNESKP